MSSIKSYHQKKILCAITGAVLVVVYCFFSSLGSGFSRYLAGFSSSIAAGYYPAYLLFMGMWMGSFKLVSLPLDFYSGFLLEHAYGLSRQSVFRWVWEHLKGLLVTLIIGAPLALAFAWCIRHFSDTWWVLSGALFFLFSIVLSSLAPVLIFPIFYKFKPLENKELENNLKAMARDCGVMVSHVFSFNLSKDTRKANAALAGMGKTRRIIISDTLLLTMTTDEITAVIAHELGHHGLNHILKSVLLGGIYIFAGLFAVSRAIELFLIHAHGFAGVSDPAAFPLIAFFLLLFGLVFTPANNYLSRRFESSADLYAKRILGKSDDLVSSLKKLGDMNMADPEPHPLVAWYSYSHPPQNKRIAALFGDTP